MGGILALFRIFQKFTEDLYMNKFFKNFDEIFWWVLTYPGYDRKKKENSRDNRQGYAAILTHLSKVFDCMYYSPLIARLNRNGFDQESLTLIYSHFLVDYKKLKPFLHLVVDKIFYILL